MQASVHAYLYPSHLSLALLNLASSRVYQLYRKNDKLINFLLPAPPTQCRIGIWPMGDLSPMTIVDTATWYEVWQAGIALAGMCARKGLPGSVLNFGKLCHCCPCRRRSRRRRRQFPLQNSLVALSSSKTCYNVETAWLNGRRADKTDIPHV